VKKHSLEIAQKILNERDEDKIEILSLIYLFGSLYYSKIIRMSYKSKATINKKINELLSLNLIKKEIDDSKRPIKVYYEFTDFGREVYHFIIKSKLKEFSSVVDYLPMFLDESWKQVIKTIKWINIALLCYEGSLKRENDKFQITSKGFERLIYREIDKIIDSIEALFEFYEKANQPEIDPEFLSELEKAVDKLSKIVKKEKNYT